MARLRAAPYDNLRSTTNNSSAFFSGQESLSGCSEPGQDGIRRNTRRDRPRCVREFARRTRQPDQAASCRRDNDRSFQNREPATRRRSAALTDWLEPRHLIRRLENDQPVEPDHLHWHNGTPPRATPPGALPFAGPDTSGRVRKAGTWLHESHPRCPGFSSRRSPDASCRNGTCSLRSWRRKRPLEEEKIKQ